MDSPDSKSPAADGPAGAVRHWKIPRLPLLVGVIGLGAVVTTGTWWSRRASAAEESALRTVRAELTDADAAVADYRARIAALRWQSEKLRAAADEERDPALKGWARERARRFDELVAKVSREDAARRYAVARASVEEACERGQLPAAKAALTRLPVVKFPPAAEVAAWREETYARPLAELSRQSPATYRAFQRAEPEAGAADLARLRKELSAAAGLGVSPQAMMAFELLSAVAPADDPVVADWTAVATAADYFEQPDAATVARWRQAQAAMRAKDWAGAAAHMQAIVRTKVRTRLPFRAAYGKTILKNQPDDVGTAYAFLEEAARAGDAEARAAVAREDLRQKRHARALAWQQAAWADGEAAAIGPLLALYAMPRDVVPRDVAREVGELKRIVVRPDAPPLASLLLGRLYEAGEGVPKSVDLARAQYQQAAERGNAEAMLELARCRAKGLGGEADAAEAGAWACRAFACGERGAALPLLLELMRNSPDAVATGVQELLEHETVAAPAGYQETRFEANGKAALKTELARYFDRKGDFAKAARLYEQSGSRDASVLSRHKELTTAHACDTCGGSGKVQSSIPCATCGGKGTVQCHVCDGRGYSFVPGTPPCTTCGGSGKMEQEGRAVACAACGGTGKGKGSVVKEECTACSHGRERCRACEGGRITISKECPDCHGSGARALADE